VARTRRLDLNGRVHVEEQVVVVVAAVVDGRLGEPVHLVAQSDVVRLRLLANIVVTLEERLILLLLLAHLMDSR